MSLIPIYNSKGDPEAFLEDPYIFNRSGEWVGFVTAQREVYSVVGRYVGFLTNDPRILRREAAAALKPKVEPPARPAKAYPPSIIPLAPLMSEPPRTTVDVLLEEPELLHTFDADEMSEEID